MITTEQISKKAVRFYPEYLADIVTESVCFPREIPFGKIKNSEDYNTIKKHIELLINSSKEVLGHGYTVELKKQNTRKHNIQSLPDKIYFETENDFLEFIGKTGEVKQFREVVQLIKKELPQLNAWILSYPVKVIQNMEDWEGLIIVCRYFLQNPKPDLYIRELPVKVHTKFIESHKGILKELLDYILPDVAVNREHSQFEKRYYLKYEETVIRLRLLDAKFREKYMQLTDIAVPLSDFKRLDLSDCVVIITENKMNFLALPCMKNCIAIWGKGISALQLIDVEWLKRVTIIYWGDMDIQGFRILSQVRDRFPQTVSIMMDQDTFDTYKIFSVQGTPEAINELANLTAEESLLFQYLYKNNIRLEQEKIDYNYVMEKLRQC